MNIERLKRMKRFKFSIIMAVYNAEDYLDEAIGSLINQSIGFDKCIQLILCDDGSTDASLSICEKYAQKHPENIIVLHQENRGVSAARNAGLAYAEGELVNFLDSDDALGKNTLAEVYHFFLAHMSDTDVISIPIYFFDGAKGEHILNKKFHQGTRIIDLKKEPEAFQLSSSSSFILHSALKGIYFDERLRYAEDMNLLLRVLMKKEKLGVVDKGRYFYRKHSEGKASAIQQSKSNAAWYLPTLKYCHESLFVYAKKAGEIPPFIQEAVMYDLQWRINTPWNTIVDTIGIDDGRKFVHMINGLLRDIDDDVILHQKHMNGELKAFALQLKYNEMPNLHFDGRCLQVMVRDREVYPLEDSYFELSFFTMHNNGSLDIEGWLNLPRLGDEDKIQSALIINDEPYICTNIPESEEQREYLGKVAGKKHYFKLHFDSMEAVFSRKNNRISACIRMGNHTVSVNTIRTGRFFPVTSKIRHAYSAYGPFLFTCTQNSIQVEKYGIYRHCYLEFRFLAELAFCSHSKAAKKAVGARLCYDVLHPFKRKEMWLISDRINKADDNGEAFFKYLHDIHAPENRYFVLKKNSTDYDTVRMYGKMLDYGTWKHKVFHLLADKTISAQADDYVYNPFGRREDYYHDILVKQKRVFLQHGIIKDDLSGWLKRQNKNLDLFFTAARPEFNSIVNGKYGYDKSVVKLTGLPRYDRLYDRKKKIITIMPTWRAYLTEKTNLDVKDGVKRYDDSFKKTEFFNFYNQLISQREFLNFARSHGYQIWFMPHPNLIPYIEWFHRENDVVFCSIHTRYREIFAKSALILTDYSSVAFDFAYLRKPVVYSQFDKHTFFTHHTYSKGYFDYERDGFGEVTYDLDSTIQCLKSYIRNDCVLKDKYRERIDRFFAFNDRKNCERVYNEIKSLEY